MRKEKGLETRFDAVDSIAVFPGNRSRVECRTGLLGAFNVLAACVKV